MSILCAVTSLFEFVILLALTGILISIAAVLRLMEVTISLVHPVTIFMVHQSGKLVIFGAGHSKRLTSSVYKKAFRMDCGDIGLVQINMRQPEVAYVRCAIPGLVEETYPLRQNGEVAEEFRGSSYIDAEKSNDDQETEDPGSVQTDENNGDEVEEEPA